MRRLKAPENRRPLPWLSPESWGKKRRDYIKWETLRRWGQLGYWEIDPPGYLLRLAREAADLTQAELGERLGVSQQAVAQAERWDANPTASYMDRWARACGARLEIRFEPVSPPADRVDDPPTRG
ncbi:MAG TPA: helix-turn-helix transcriptional regulator [Gemmatimonadota bacterium]|nr:helix-turn-helix transcriptional regulator [Gemmatimonadota bacterium]